MTQAKTTAQIKREEAYARHSAATRTVDRLLGIRRSTHETQIYETGIAWVECQFYYDPKRIAQFVESPVFWNWWKAQWYTRNYELLLRHGLDIHHSKPLPDASRNQLMEDMDTSHRMALLQLKPSGALLKAVVSNHYRNQA